MQTLNVQLHVGLTNGTPARDGTFEVNEAVGIALRWRKCDAPRAPAPGESDDGRRAGRDRDDEDRDDRDDEDRDDWDDEDGSSDEWWGDDSDDWWD